MPFGRRRAPLTLGGMRLRSSQKQEKMFSHSFPGPVIGGQVYRVPKDMEEKKARVE